MASRLYLVPTPIGNLEDITLRALRVLREADWIAAEDTRRARVLLQHYDIGTRPVPHHAHNEHAQTPKLVERLLDGETGALISDAGMPGIADPGFLLAREARLAGAEVEVLPGPSAVTTAVVASGFPPEPFLFLGFVPTTAGRRLRLLREMADDPRTSVVFEVPHRIRKTLQAAEEIWQERPVALLRELTKIHEEAIRGTASQVLATLPEKPKGEMVLVLSPTPRKTK